MLIVLQLKLCDLLCHASDVVSHGLVAANDLIWRQILLYLLLRERGGLKEGSSMGGIERVALVDDTLAM